VKDFDEKSSVSKKLEAVMMMMMMMMIGGRCWSIFLLTTASVIDC